MLLDDAIADVRVVPPKNVARLTRAHGLVYVSDQQPGLTRRRSGEAFVYFHASGRAVRSSATIQRVRKLAIPPAYTDVWICADADGHIQATGRDARGRKQYRYHAQWRVARDTVKYDRLGAFADHLPKLRAQVRSDLQLDGLPRRKVVATLVRLLQASLIRVGNEEYSRDNGSYGLATMRNRHVRVRGQTLKFDFRGKSGKFHSIELNDARLARIVRQCQDLPGQNLFQFRAEDGTVQRIDSDDVNAYIREFAGGEFSAKDFRTWAGTLLTARALCAAQPAETQGERKQRIVAAIAEVSERLGNTASVCRKCYIHPAVLDAYTAGQLSLPRTPRSQSITHLSAQERSLRRLLRVDEKRRSRAKR
jgi:DNA topoisomerase I